MAAQVWAAAPLSAAVLVLAVFPAVAPAVLARPQASLPLFCRCKDAGAHHTRPGSFRLERSGAPAIPGFFIPSFFTSGESPPLGTWVEHSIFGWTEGKMRSRPVMAVDVAGTAPGLMQA